MLISSIIPFAFISMFVFLGIWIIQDQIAERKYKKSLENKIPCLVTAIQSLNISNAQTSDLQLFKDFFAN